VRLNLKKPRYSKGGIKKTGSFYKKQKWKKIKSSSCFKCGQTGHWASSCTQTNSDIDAKADQVSVTVKLSTTDSLVAQELKVCTCMYVYVYIYICKH